MENIELSRTLVHQFLIGKILLISSSTKIFFTKQTLESRVHPCPDQSVPQHGCR
jgi:hypothetical protein